MTSPGFWPSRQFSMPDAVGIIANPQSGKDTRRITADATVINNHDKVGIVRRVFRALARLGVERVLVMPDEFGIGLRATDTAGVAVEMLAMEIEGTARDSEEAARRMAPDVSCIITLGGDGTNRAVARGSADTPLLPISTGTNNVFPMTIDGTVAGMAAAGLALGIVSATEVCWRSKAIVVAVDGSTDLALVDAAITTEAFVGAKAVWDPSIVTFLMVTQAAPSNIGLSSVAGMLAPIGREEPLGLAVELGASLATILAPIAPGRLQPISVRRWERVAPGYRRCFRATRAGTIALDGEREVTFLPGQEICLELTTAGPLVMRPYVTVALMAERAAFRLR